MQIPDIIPRILGSRITTTPPQPSLPAGVTNDETKNYMKVLGGIFSGRDDGKADIGKDRRLASSSSWSWPGDTLPAIPAEREGCGDRRAVRKEIFSR